MTLAQLRDPEGIPDIEAFMREWGEGRSWPYYTRLGRVVIEYVRAGRPGIFALVGLHHEHALTLATCDLIRAVAADDEMAELLERVSATDPEEECRVEFAETASAIRGSGETGGPAA